MTVSMFLEDFTLLNILNKDSVMSNDSIHLEQIKQRVKFNILTAIVQAIQNDNHVKAQPNNRNFQ